MKSVLILIAHGRAAAKLPDDGQQDGPGQQRAKQQSRQDAAADEQNECGAAAEQEDDSGGDSVRAMAGRAGSHDLYGDGRI